MPRATRAADDHPIELFVSLAQRGHVPLLQRVTGTIRFDIVSGEETAYWLLSIHKGDVSVSRRKVRADAVVRAEESLFKEIVSGRTNAQAAYLRGAFSVEGDMGLAVQFLRLVPGPPDAKGPRRLMSEAGLVESEPLR
jgi:SCP-2 sterol transfer family